MDFINKTICSLLQNIQIKGDYLKVDIIQASNRRFAFSNDKNLHIVTKVRKRLLAVLQEQDLSRHFNEANSLQS